MSTKDSLIQLIERLWKHLSQRRQKQFSLLILLMLIASLAEMVSIGAVLPFLGVLTAPEHIFAAPVMQPIIVFFGYEKPEQLMLPITIGFIVATLAAGVTRLTLLYVTTRLSFAAGADISINIYRRTLYQSYDVHTSRNSSELINGIINKTNTVIYGIFMPVLTLISSIIILVVILITLLIIDPFIALGAIVGFGGIYGGIIWATRRRLAGNSKLIADNSTQVIKSLQEGLGGIRDILIDGSQELYCSIYRNADLPLRRAQGDIHIISGSPRFLIEALGMMLIAMVAYFMTQHTDGFTSAIPVLGALAIGAQRLLPILQQGYSSISGIKAAESSVIDTLSLLDQEISEFIQNTNLKSIPFKQKIKLNNLSFRYGNENSWVLKNINLTITKGSRVGFIGETGSGKSTLLDIVMGLLKPTEGTFIVDNQLVTAVNIQSWQVHVAHVPQNIYLADSTLYENIAFGVPLDKIDKERVRHAARQAHIAEVIESWPKKYQTFVGERGIRLSGGQKQRIGIARALYKNADLIILDEATSALDNETEQAVMEAINELSDDLTILIIAHRLTTLKNCDQIIELGNSGILRTGDYKKLVNL
ncbi:MAG: ABC transporter ATP-binding protein/permease [Gammaproteobacteria bacterium]|nr:ABC transporter ATP-binding protein/permease [Gammaproteobacteria bacterium]